MMRGGLQLGRGSPVMEQLAAVRWGLIRRIFSAIASSFSNRRFAFTFCALITLVAKGVHIYAHRVALTEETLNKWGYSFFGQDFVLLIFIHVLVSGALEPTAIGFLRVLHLVFVPAFTFGVSFLGFANICVFADTGAEVHWHNATMASDPAGRAVLLSGLFTAAYLFAFFFICSLILQIPIYTIFGCGADIFLSPFWFVAHCVRTRGRIFSRRSSKAHSSVQYSQLSRDDPESFEAQDFELSSPDLDNSDEKDNLLSSDNNIGSSFKFQTPSRVPQWLHPRNWPWVLFFWIIMYAGVMAGLLACAIITSQRPGETSMMIMSWTAAALPFAHLGNSSPALFKISPLYKSGIGRSWDDKTALRAPLLWNWLPKDRTPAGFEDWYTNGNHYRASADPLKIDNLNEALYAELEGLKDAPIRHVITIILESTRKDVFPVKNNDYTQKILAKSFADSKLPDDALERLRTLTPTARYLTGDYEDGFDHPEETHHKGRGGLNFNDAYTTSTYTLKSVAGSLCGVSPLVADFNVEYKHHIYQPCLPQIFDVIGQIEHTDAAANFTSYPWKSTFMQSVTMGFDYNGGLLNAMGYHNIVDKEYLQSDNAKFGKVTLPDVNYFGFQEEPLLDYMRDEFEMAKENNGRVFISHLTSTSHHPYSLPSGETSVPLANGLDDLSKYMNAIGYDDRWLAKVLNMLEETGVANETLVVFVGDHGLSIPENGKLPSYYNPHTVINHIPMVFSHPSIPPISINSSVSAQQIVPTILDLLIETNSLSPPATKAAKDLVSNYEGQSLIRPTKETGESVRNWQFTIVNPGGAQIGIRDAFNKNFHLVIPAIDNVEWHFSEDPHDESVVVGFDFHDFLRQIEKGHGIEAAHWAEEAAFVGRWWVEENSKRWRYGPYATY